MDSVSVSLYGTQVKIQWTPGESNASPITAFKVLIMTSNPLISLESLDYCDGTTNNIIAQNYCLIPMLAFLASPYNLEQGDLIIATVQARNAIGWSVSSLPNVTGQNVETTPNGTPADLIIHLESTNEYQIALEMTPMVAAAATGGSPIVSYSLEWDDASS